MQTINLKFDETLNSSHAFILPWKYQSEREITIMLVGLPYDFHIHVHM